MVLNIAELFKKQNMKFFGLVSSVNSNANSKFLYLRTKGELEEDIKKLKFETFHVYRPAFLRNRLEFRLTEFFFAKILVLFYDWFSFKNLVIDVPDLAVSIFKSIISSSFNENNIPNFQIFENVLLFTTFSVLNDVSQFFVFSNNFLFFCINFALYQFLSFPRYFCV